jgi:hypothetical protein
VVRADVGVRRTGGAQDDCGRRGQNGDSLEDEEPTPRRLQLRIGTLLDWNRLAFGIFAHSHAPRFKAPVAMLSDQAVGRRNRHSQMPGTLAVFLTLGKPRVMPQMSQGRLRGLD